MKKAKNNTVNNEKIIDSTAVCPRYHIRLNSSMNPLCGLDANNRKGLSRVRSTFVILVHNFALPSDSEDRKVTSSLSTGRGNLANKRAKLQTTHPSSEL